jgi:ribosomal subunit interface protein
VEIVVRGRHTEVPERFRQHVEEKLARVGKHDGKVIRIDVEVCRERNPRLADVAERVELTCATRGPVIRAEAAASDPYAALDLAYAKLEARLRKAADRRRVHRGARTPVSVAQATANAALIPEPPIAAEEEAPEVLEEGPLIVREKVHTTSPMTLDEALFEMELVGHDFFLFFDEKTSMPSVVYRRRGYDYGVIRLDVK